MFNFCTFLWLRKSTFNCNFLENYFLIYLQNFFKITFYEPCRSITIQNLQIHKNILFFSISFNSAIAKGEKILSCLERIFFYRVVKYFLLTGIFFLSKDLFLQWKLVVLFAICWERIPIWKLACIKWSIKKCCNLSHL